MKKSRKPRTKFQLQANESLTDGLKRIIAEQLELTLWYLARDSKPLEKIAHETRKATKRMRTVLRLLRSSHPKGFRRLNARLRGVAHELSPLRDSQALVDVLDEISGQFTGPDATESAARLRDHFIEHRRMTGENFRQLKKRDALAQELGKVRTQLETRPFPKIHATVLLKGVARTVAEGRRGYCDAYRDMRPELFHEWRKRAKNLNYSLQLLRKRCSAVASAFDESMEDMTNELSDVLGEDHNAAVLRKTVNEMIQLGFHELAGVSESFREPLNKAIDNYQSDLRARAKRLGYRVYSDTAGASHLQ